MRTVATGYRFADGTDITAAASLADIEGEMARFGATGFLTYRDDVRRFSVVGFHLPDIGAFLLYIPLPDEAKFGKDKAPVATKSGKKPFKSAFEQEYARILRVVVNLVKTKLAAVQEGVTSVEREFFSDLVIYTGNGRQQTVFEWYAPQIEHLRREGLTPPVLPAIEEPKMLSGSKAVFRATIEGSK